MSEEKEFRRRIVEAAAEMMAEMAGNGKGEVRAMFSRGVHPNNMRTLDEEEDE